MMISRCAVLCLMLLVPLGVFAAGVAVDEQPLADPAQEAQARQIMAEIRCLVCQNQSIEDSNADLARDLRTIVRERVAAGDSADAVKDFLVARYGDWVLLDPPFNARTLALWVFPPLLLVVVLAAVLLRLRRRPELTPEPLSAEERDRVAALLEKGDRA